MGCVASKPDINDHHHNIFQVVNVDDLGHRFTAAKLEVTEGELILHQRGKTATHWPLRCLRRYGFDAELFSFESGRRCPTGPGIYAFKCRRAEALFNLLQQQIQNITEDAAAAPPPPQQELLEDMRASVGERTVPGDLRTSLNEHRGDLRNALNEHRSALDHRNAIGASAGSNDPDVYLEPKPRSHSMRHTSVTSGAPAGSNSVLPRVGTGSMAAGNPGVMGVGACIGGSGSFSGGCVGGGGGSFNSGGCGGGGFTTAGYNTGYNNTSERSNSLSYRPSVDRANSNGNFTYGVTDAAENGDGGGGSGGGGGGGAGVGGAGGGGIRSPASPPAPLSSLPVTYYDERSDDTPPTPGRDPPPTPTENPHICLNQRTNTVTYDTHASSRPLSFPVCPQSTQLSSVRRPRAYVNKMNLYDGNRSNLVYVNVGPEPHERSHVYVNLTQDKAEGPAVPPRTSLVPPGGACGAIGGGCGSLSAMAGGCGSLVGRMRSNGGCGSTMVASGGCGPSMGMGGGFGPLSGVPGGCGSLGAMAGGCGSGSSHSGTTTDTDQQNSQVNYIMVELEGNSDSSVVVPASPQGSVTSCPESPHHSTVENYTQIDMDKTLALSTVKSQGLWEDGLRKTRHNSTFSSPVVLLRNNSSLSD